MYNCLKDIFLLEKIGFGGEGKAEGGRGEEFGGKGRWGGAEGRFVGELMWEREREERGDG